MKTWAEIRELARTIHGSMVGDRLDYTAADLLSNAESSTEIKLKATAANDNLLSGAQALLDVEYGVIRFNREVDPRLAMYFIAHEYAHFWIDGHKAECFPEALDYEAVESDPATAISKVEGYSPHERTELQANVFAREFLAPTDKLRIRFVEKGESASSIADQLGVDAGLVHHQLMHAILPYERHLNRASLPKIGRSPDLDPSQKAAATVLNGPLLVEAGPGTGKTSTLIGRILFLLEEQKIEPTSILALTFSNKAAEEMRARIAQVAPDAAPHIWIGTFHAFGLELLRKFGDRIGLSETPKVVDQAAAILLLESDLVSLGLNHYLNLYDPALDLIPMLEAISRAKDELVSPDEYRTLAEKQLDTAADDEEREIAERALEVANVYRVYEHKLLEADSIDFGDLIYKSVQMLRSNTRVLGHLHQQYTHILVDEFQDVNHASGVLLQLIARGGEGLWAVGDTRQSIYRFRGASPTNVSEFSKTYPDAQRRSLKTNYRSQKKVIEAFGLFAEHMAGEKGFTKWVAHRTDGEGSITMRVAQSSEEEGRLLGEWIAAQRATGIAYREQVVLCRTHSNLNRIARMLESQGIPVLYMGELFEREEIRDLMSLLSLISEPFGNALLRVGRFPDYAIPLEDIRLVLDLAKANRHFYTDILPNVGQIEGLSDAAKNGLSRMKADLEGITYKTTAWSVLTTYLFERTEHIRQLMRDETIGGKQKRLAVHQLLSFIYSVRETPEGFRGDPKRWVLDKVLRMLSFGESKQLRHPPSSAEGIDAVRLLTVHASKGLEFRSVHLPFMAKTKFPLRPQGHRCPPPRGMLPDEYAENWESDEEQSLFFVALSRAQDTIYLSRATSYGKTRNAHSPFLDAIGPLLPGGFNDQGKKVAAQDTEVAPEDVANHDYEVDALDLYLRCNRRYFYRYELMLGSSSTDSAYQQTHNCVNAALAWFEEEQRKGKTVTQTEVLAKLDESVEESGPKRPGLEEIYRVFARDLVINTLNRRKEDPDAERRPQWLVQLQTGRVLMRPDEVGRAHDGSPIVRRVRAGRISSTERTKDIYALYHQAGREQYGQDVPIEVLSLTQDTSEQVAMGDNMIANRLRKYEGAMADIQANKFDAKPTDVRDCPRCPYFIVCQSPVEE